VDDWYVENLVCPRDRQRLRARNNVLECLNRHEYPVIQGIPVMLLEESDDTLWVARASLNLARSGAGGKEEDRFCLETLGCDAEERDAIRRLLQDPKCGAEVDPVVQYMVAQTSGRQYASLRGRLSVYPIPEFPMPASTGERLLDIGCNWGRWTIGSAQKGYRSVGLDPSLGAVLAARRVSAQLGCSTRFVVGDARHLPFDQDAFDRVFSFGVFQHFSKDNVVRALSETGRVLKKGGMSKIQMASAFGLRSLEIQARRGFREPTALKCDIGRPLK
jgi:uncharacterized protein YbaR (Trm112 family)